MILSALTIWSGFVDTERFDHIVSLCVSEHVIIVAAAEVADPEVAAAENASFITW